MRTIQLLLLLGVALTLLTCAYVAHAQHHHRPPRLRPAHLVEALLLFWLYALLAVLLYLTPCLRSSTL